MYILGDMIEKKEVGNSKAVSSKIVNIDDRKLLLGLAFVFIVGTLVSGSFTGNAGRVGVMTQLKYNELLLNEGWVEEYPENSNNWIRLDRISEDGTIVVQVTNEQDKVERYIRPGDEIYMNGLFITNVATSYREKNAKLEIN